MIYYLAMSTQGNQSASGPGQSHQTQSQETAIVTSVSDTQAVSNASVTTVTATTGSTVMSQPLESTGGTKTEVTSADPMQQGIGLQDVCLGASVQEQKSESIDKAGIHLVWDTSGGWTSTLVV